MNDVIHYSADKMVLVSLNLNECRIYAYQYIIGI